MSSGGSASGGGGRNNNNPLSLATVVVIRKNVNSRKAISAIEALGISGVDLAILFEGFTDFRINKSQR